MPLLKSLIRKINNTFHGGLKEKIFFLHIPKCGGMSIQDAIVGHYQTLGFTKHSRLFSLSAAASSSVIKMINKTDYPYDTTDDYPILKFRESLLLYNINIEKAFISGHFSLTELAYRQLQGKYACITILRDPVKRWISSYFFNRYKTSSDHRKIEDDVLEHLESPFGHAQGYELVKFLGGPVRDGDYTSSEAIKRAKENLYHFDIVGFLEHHNQFINQFYARFGRKLNVRQINPSPVSKSYQRSIVDEAVKREIAAVCSPDREVYDYAINHFL